MPYNNLSRLADVIRQGLPPVREESIRTGQPYQIRLVRPSADPRWWHALKGEGPV